MTRRREFLKDSALVAAGLAGLGTLAAELPSQRESLWAAQPQSAKDTIVVGWEAEMATLDPSKTVCAHELRYDQQVGETMWHLQGGSSQIKPSLGTQWQSSKDGKEWTFTVRPGVRFQDGTPCRAQDIQWTYDRWMDPKNPFHDPPYGLLQYFLGALDKVQAVDDTTVKFYLKHLDAAFDSNMLWPHTSAVSSTALKKLGKQKFALKPVCTGPWQVVDWTKGTRLILERNSTYWGAQPILRRMIIKPIPEDAVRLEQLKSGEVDVIVALPPQFIPEVLGDPNLKLLRRVGNHIWWIALNVREKPLADKRIRQALNYATDKEAIVRNLLKGGGKVAAGPMMVGSWSEDHTLQPYPYDPKKAKQLLEAGGYGSGFHTRFWVPESGSGMIAPKDIATLVQAQLKEVGVTVEIVTQEWTSYVADYGSVGFAPSGKPGYGMGEMSWNTPLPDPVHYVDVNLKTDAQPPKGFNAGFYSNPDVDRLLTQAASTLDREQRKTLYAQAQKIVHDEAPWIFTFSVENLVATRKNIQGLEVNACPWWLDFTGTYVQR
jgi:peptide/nickel transport system substrate-binding protein